MNNLENNEEHKPHIKIVGLGDFGRNVVDKLEKSWGKHLSYHVLETGGQSYMHNNDEIVAGLNDCDLVFFLADMEKMTVKMSDETSEILSLARISKEKDVFGIAICAVPNFVDSDEIYRQFLNIGQNFGGYIPLMETKEANCNVSENAYLAVEGLVSMLFMTGFINLELVDMVSHFTGGKPTKFVSKMGSGKNRVDEILEKSLQGFDLLVLSEITSVCISVVGNDVTMDEYHKITEGIVGAVTVEGAEHPDVYVGITEENESNNDSINLNELRVSVYLNG